MQIHEEVKLMLCYLLHHLNDVQLRHRVEYTISFAQGYMGALQTDQLRRYVEIKQSDMPSAVAAKKTKEFRCPPRDQVNSHEPYCHNSSMVSRAVCHQGSPRFKS